MPNSALREGYRPSSSVVLILFALLTPASPLAGQAQPDGPQRFWVELGLGGSRQDPNCTACQQKSSIGGPRACFNLSEAKGSG